MSIGAAIIIWPDRAMEVLKDLPSHVDPDKVLRLLVDWIISTPIRLNLPFLMHTHVSQGSKE